MATADERHVFGSFISREAAYRLMLSVCRPAVSPEFVPEIVPKLPPDVEISSIEDDSSCSVSGNESPPNMQDASSNEHSPSMTGGGDTSSSSPTTNDSALSTNLESSLPNEESFLIKNVPQNNNIPTTISAVTPTTAIITSVKNSTKEPVIGFNVVPPDVSPSPNLKMHHNKFKFPTDIHVIYLGVILAVILSLVSGFLLYKIQARTSEYSSLDFKLVSNCVF